MWRSGTRVIAAVSGGSDSVSMLLLLHDLHHAGDLHLDSIAHLNHQIRAEASDDEAFCLELAERLGIPFASRTIDVPALARERRQSLELAGRVARRAFLDELRRARNADCVATAHTEDDQAETVLLRLIRGTGSRGLAGIAPCRDRRIRPVLCATREELRGELLARGQGWREDQTNRDLAHARNRVRHELLPYLEQHFNPSARRALARAADVVRGEDAMLARAAAAAAAGIIRSEPAGVSIDSRLLERLPDALARRVVIYGLAAARVSAPSHEDVEAVLDVARGSVAAADLSSARAEHFDGNVVLVSSPPRASGPFRLDLPVPGRILTESGWLVEAEPFGSPQPVTPDSGVAQIDAAVVSGGLVVRSRLAGDRLRPVGLGGRKKVQDVFVDRKVPRRERDGVPIVTDRSERIIWVAGHVLAEEFRVTERTNGVIILKLRRI